MSLCVDVRPVVCHIPIMQTIDSTHIGMSLSLSIVGFALGFYALAAVLGGLWLLWGLRAGGDDNNDNELGDTTDEQIN